MKDIMGQEIKVGSLIAYPGRMGSSLWITVARVLALGTKKRGWSDKTEPTLTVEIKKSSDTYIEPGRKSTIYALDRILVVQEPDGKNKAEGVQVP